MPDIDGDLEAALPSLKAYNQTANPTTAQNTAILKVVVQCVARLIFARLNHPTDTP